MEEKTKWSEKRREEKREEARSMTHLRVWLCVWGATLERETRVHSGGHLLHLLPTCEGAFVFLFRFLFGGPLVFERVWPVGIGGQWAARLRVCERLQVATWRAHLELLGSG